MLFYANHFGQLCNRLWAIVPAYTFAKEHNIRLNILFADKSYLDLFPNARKDANIKFWFLNIPPSNWFVKIVNFFLKKKEIKGELREIKFCRYRCSSINGWNHHNDISYTDNVEFKKSLLRTFAFSDEVIQQVKSVLDGFEGKTIGVHIRRGDYRQWMNGKYCYDDKTWHRIMLSIQQQLSVNANSSTRFCICSNEPISIKDSNIPIIQIPDTNGIKDLCALSLCDYIVGPPSTFSQWASYISNTPLHFVLSPEEEVKISDFSPIVRCDVFENSKRLMLDDVNVCFFEEMKKL